MYFDSLCRRISCGNSYFYAGNLQLRTSYNTQHSKVMVTGHKLKRNRPVMTESAKIPQVGVLNRHPGLLSDILLSLLLRADMSERPRFLSALLPHHPNNANLRDTNFRGLLICRPKRQSYGEKEMTGSLFFFQPTEPHFLKAQTQC